MKTILIVLAISFGLLPFFTYFLSIKKWYKTGIGTQPTKVTLIIWAILDIFIFTTYLLSNGWNIVTFMSLAYTIGALSVSYAAIKYGTWGMTKRERRESFTVLVGAIIGILAWLYYSSAIIGHYFLITTLLISILPLVKKIYKEPWKEDLKSWLMWFMANNFALASIFIYDGWTIENGLLVSVYFLLYVVMLIPMIRYWYYNKRIISFYYFGESPYKMMNTGDKRVCIKITEDEAIKIFLKNETVNTATEDSYIIHIQSNKHYGYYIKNIAVILSRKGLKNFFKRIDYYRIKNPNYGF